MNTETPTGPLERLVMRLLSDIDELIEAAELHGWHDKPEYKMAKAAHAQLTAECNRMHDELKACHVFHDLVVGEGAWDRFRALERKVFEHPAPHASDYAALVSAAEAEFERRAKEPHNAY